MIDHSSLSQYAHAAYVELFRLRLDNVTGNQNEFLFFTNQTHPDGSYVRFQGIEYYPLPVQIESVEATTQGSLPSPTLRLSNVTPKGQALRSVYLNTTSSSAPQANPGVNYGTFSYLVRQYNDLVGAELLRLKTLSIFLDGSPTADPEQYEEAIYYVERKTEETALAITWELATAFPADLGKLPGGIILRSCTAQYKDAACGWDPAITGRYIDRSGNVITNPALYHLDDCSRRYRDGCFPRYGSTTFGIRINGFPAIDMGR